MKHLTRLGMGLLILLAVFGVVLVLYYSGDYGFYFVSIVWFVGAAYGIGMVAERP